MPSPAEVAISCLANALWQVPLLAAAGKLGARLLRRAPAAYAHGLWLAVLIAAVALPVASPFLAALRSPIATELESSSPAFAEAPLAAAAGGARAGAVEPITLPAAAMGTAGRIVLLAYLALVAVACLRLALAVRRAAALRRRATPIPAGALVSDLAIRLGRTLGVARVELLASDEVAGPVTIGIRRPAIVLPPWLLRGASRAEIESVLGHELAHVARRDCAVHLAAETLLLPLAPHPAAWWLRAELARAREMACDEAAAAALSDGRAYARSLLGLAVSIAGHASPAATLGAFDSDNLEERMKRLLDGSRRLSSASARWVLAGCLAVLVAGAWCAAGFALAAPATGSDLSRYVGVWRGDYDDGWGKGMPGATLTVTTVEGQPRVAILMYRHLKQPDGSVQSAATGFPVVDVAFAQGQLTFRSRDDNFRFKGGPKESVDYHWAFEVTGEDQGRLSLVHNSRFKAQADRGEHVPPGPPPIEMRKDP